MKELTELVYQIIKDNRQRINNLFELPEKLDKMNEQLHTLNANLESIDATLMYINMNIREKSNCS